MIWIVTVALIIAFFIGMVTGAAIALLAVSQDEQWRNDNWGG